MSVFSSRHRRALRIAALAGCAWLAGGAPSHAQGVGFLDALRNIFSGSGASDVRPIYSALPRPRRAARTELWSDEPAAPRSRFREERTERRFSPIVRATADGGGSRESGGRLLCVRTCDGYVFPLGGTGRASDWAEPGAACHAACPGATTAVYKGGSASDPSGAKAADGSRYRQLASALLFRKERVAQCSCQGEASVGARLSLLADPTLRRGDVVVAADGTPRVFEGDRAAHHQPEEFGPVRGSPSLSRTAQARIEGTIGQPARSPEARAIRVATIDEAAAVSPRRQAALVPIEAPAGTAGNVRVFTVVSGAAGPAARTVGPAIYVIR